MKYKSMSYDDIARSIAEYVFGGSCNDARETLKRRKEILEDVARCVSGESLDRAKDIHSRYREHIMLIGKIMLSIDPDSDHAEEALVGGFQTMFVYAYMKGQEDLKNEENGGK